MRGRRRASAALALVLSCGGLAAGLMHPASADTTCADVWVERESTTPAYLLGPGNCTETGYDKALHFGQGGQETGVVPPGYPDGYGFDVWLTAPPPP